MARVRYVTSLRSIPLLCLVVILLVAPLTVGGAAKLRVGAALPGIITDKAWNQGGYEGLKLIEKELGGEIAYTERVAQPDQVEVMSDYARRGFDLVFGHGGEYDAAGRAVAARFPKTKVVVNNGTVTGPNLGSLQVNHFQIAFLGGVVAGMMTKSNKIAAISAQKFKAIDDGFAGFEAGAKWVNPKVQMFTSYTGNWDDVAKGKEAAFAHIAKGADVVFGVLDHAQLGVLQGAMERNVWAVGYVGDMLVVAPKTVLTSSIEDISQAMLVLAKLIADGKFQGKSYVIGLENPRVARLGAYGAMVPQRVKDKVEEAKKKLIAGQIKQ